MKQPLMIIPPAQAEALYDAALEDEKNTDRFRLPNPAKAADDWDDGHPAESHDGNRSPQRGIGTRPQRSMYA